MNIRDTQNSMLTGCAILRVVFCFFVAYLESKREQEETIVLIDRRCHFSPKHCIVLIEIPAL